MNFCEHFIVLSDIITCLLQQPGQVSGSVGSLQSPTGAFEDRDTHDKLVRGDLANYRGHIVTLKQLHSKQVKITRKVKVEFKEVGDVC